MLGLSQQLQEKWAPVLEHGDLPAIEDNYKKARHFDPPGKPRACNS